MIALRKSDEYSNTLVYGAFETYKPEQKNLLAYTRILDKNIIVLANYMSEPQEVVLPGPAKKVLLSNTNRTLPDEATITLTGYELLVMAF